MSSDPPAIAAVIPAYNRGALIERSIRSAQAQTVPMREIVVVDDRSTDDTAEVVERLAADDPRIRLVRHERNGGPSRARNTGVREASPECRWIAPLDSDDEWMPTKTERQLEALERFRRAGLPEPGCVYTGHVERESDGTECIRRSAAEGDVLADVLDDFCQIPSGVLVRRDRYDAIGGMDPLITSGEDHDFVIRLAGSTTFAAVDEVLAIRHMHDSEQNSWNLAGMPRFIERHAAAIRKHHGRDGLARFLFRYANLYQHSGDWRAGLRLAAWGLWLSPQGKFGVWVLWRCLLQAAGRR